MRSDWVPWSASALVIGAMSLVFGSVLNPSDPGASAGQTFGVVQDDSARWLAMAVMFVLASLCLTLGLPAITVLLERRGRLLGGAGLALLTFGAIGTCGYGMLLVFFRALVVHGGLQRTRFDEVGADVSLNIFVYAWIGAFYGGVLLVALALMAARTVPRWVPLTLVVFVVALPVSGHIGRVGAAIQVMLFAVGITGIAMTAVADTRRVVAAPMVG